MIFRRAKVAIFALLASSAAISLSAFDSWTPSPDFNMKAFLQILEEFESRGSGSYTAVNSVTKAAGRYQFLAPPLMDLGYVVSTTGGKTWDSGIVFTEKARAMGVSSFADMVSGSAASIDFQDNAAVEYARLMWDSYLTTAKAKIGTSVWGIPVTEGGVLALSWFTGAGRANTLASGNFSIAALSESDQQLVIKQNGFANGAVYQNHLNERLDKGRRAMLGAGDNIV